MTNISGWFGTEIFSGNDVTTICDATRDIIEVRTGGYMSAARPMIASLRSFNSRGSDLGIMCACGEKCR